MINEIGNKYGKLTVIERAIRPEGRPAGAYWLCQCECGNKKIVRGAELRNGGTQSCGCLLGKHSIKNEIGNKYGNLTVIDITNERSFGSVCWKCKCDCGNIVIVPGDALRIGSTKSCGCLIKKQSREKNGINRAGEKHGLLTVLYIDEEKTKKHSHGLYWKCKCECGNETSVLGTFLANGSVKSCGCLKNSYGENLIEKILIDNNISYAKEYSFPDLKSKTNGTLRFDFAIFNNNKLAQLIEYDGEQHYKAVEIWGGEEGLIRR